MTRSSGACAMPSRSRKRHALRPRPFPDLGLQEPLADGERQFAAMLAGDHRMHHVERRGAAAAGQAVAVDLVERAAQVEGRIFLQQGRRMFPMDGEAIAGEQIGPRQQIRPPRDAADPHPTPRELAQPGEAWLVPKKRRVPAGADEEVIELQCRPDAGIRRDGDAVRSQRRRAVDRDMAPAVELPA